MEVQQAHGGGKMLEERLVLERMRGVVIKEQADLRVERANWERDRLKAERDELQARVVKLQAILDKEKRKRTTTTGFSYTPGVRFAAAGQQQNAKYMFSVPEEDKD